MIRRFGEQPLSDISYTPRPGVYVILPQDHNLLVTFQTEPAPEYQLPGGGVDAGEHPIAALHREVMEETGWIIGTPKRLGAFRRFTYMPEYDLYAEKICTIYVARPVYRKSSPSEPDHHPVLLPIDVALSALASEGDRRAVAKFFGARHLKP